MGKKEKKGKEYNKQGKLLFEGEYLYNYKYKGKGYHKGKLDIEGEYRIKYIKNDIRTNYIQFFELFYIII